MKIRNILYILLLTFTLVLSNELSASCVKHFSMEAFEENTGAKVIFHQLDDPVSPLNERYQKDLIDSYLHLKLEAGPGREDNLNFTFDNIRYKGKGTKYFLPLKSDSIGLETRIEETVLTFGPHSKDLDRCKQCTNYDRKITWEKKSTWKQGYRLGDAHLYIMYDIKRNGSSNQRGGSSPYTVTSLNVQPVTIDWKLKNKSSSWEPIIKLWKEKRSVIKASDLKIKNES